MIVSIISLIAGALMVLWGADKLTDAAIAIARRFGISELIIGLTIVAMGTSLPEFVISMSAVVQGSSDLSVGNIVGSNLFNVLVIVGLSAVCSPISVGRGTISKDIPFALLAGVMLILSCYDGVILPTEGLTMLCFFAIFMWYTFSVSHNDAPKSSPLPAPDIKIKDDKVTVVSLWLSVLFGVLGVIVLVWGGNMFVEGASAIAYALGVSELVVGLTIVAVGTSLPELATSVVAAIKGSSALAIGNVIGSNLFNVFLIMGLSSSFGAMPVDGLTIIDQLLLVVSVLMMWLFAATDRRIVRWEGCVMVVTYIAYTVYLIW